MSASDTIVTGLADFNLCATCELMIIPESLCHYFHGALILPTNFHAIHLRIAIPNRHWSLVVLSRCCFQQAVELGVYYRYSDRISAERHIMLRAPGLVIYNAAEDHPHVPAPKMPCDATTTAEWLYLPMSR
jgi:hypothetical protein